MSKLSKALKHPGKALGNLVKNVAPLAAFTPIGALGAAGLAVGGGLLRHEKPGQLLKSGVSNAAIGGGLASIGGKIGIGSGAHLGFGLGEGGSAPAVTQGGHTISAGDLSGPLTDGTGTAGVSVPATSGGLGGISGVAGKALDFAEAHPNTIGGALNAVGSLSTSGSENRLRDAQATNLEQQADETSYDFEQRKRREELLKPIWSALGTHVSDGYAGVAPNPYSRAG